MIRPMDFDRSADVWTYRPESHKTEHHGKERIIYIGPQAQGILLRYLARDVAAYCFRPIDSEAKRRTANTRPVGRHSPVAISRAPIARPRPSVRLAIATALTHFAGQSIEAATWRFHTRTCPC